MVRSLTTTSMMFITPTAPTQRVIEARGGEKDADAEVERRHELPHLLEVEVVHGAAIVGTKPVMEAEEAAGVDGRRPARRRASSARR